MQYLSVVMLLLTEKKLIGKYCQLIFFSFNKSITTDKMKNFLQLKLNENKNNYLLN